MKDEGRVRLAEPADAQAAPLRYEIDGRVGLVKIDHAISTQGVTFVAGWTSDGSLLVELASASGVTGADLVRTVRDDVASGLRQPATNRHGFVLIATPPPDEPLNICFGQQEARFCLPLTVIENFQLDARISCAPGTFAALSARRVGSRDWRLFLSLLPERETSGLIVEGIIDVAYSSPVEANGFAQGWVTHKPDTLVWIEDDQGRAHDLEEGYRWVRRDVRSQIHHLPGPGQETGFHLRTRFHPEARSIRLAAANKDGSQRLAARPVSHLPFEAKEVVAALAEATTPRHDLPARIRRVDLPVLAAARASEREVWASAEIRERMVGSVPSNPTVSLIVPLYGRVDFIEHQLLEFDRDPAFIQDVEIIYVLDDPDLENPLHFDAHRMQAVSGPGFRWVTTGENRGFSGANNLGASVARGRVLCFMNSDVFPLAPGWAIHLAEVLDRHGDLGMLAPRLIFPNGSIQHVGMVARWRPEWQLFTNHHPSMGMPTSADPSHGLTRVPLVTGACVALPREVFERIGGWDEGYISGDFEDSDLCFRVRDIGRTVGYDPRVELLHLERQSVELTSDDALLKERMTLLNACRYNQHWHEQVREIAE